MIETLLQCLGAEKWIKNLHYSDISIRIKKKCISICWWHDAYLYNARSRNIKTCVRASCCSRVTYTCTDAEIAAVVDAHTSLYRHEFALTHHVADLLYVLLALRHATLSSPRTHSCIHALTRDSGRFWLHAIRCYIELSLYFGLIKGLYVDHTPKYWQSRKNFAHYFINYFEYLRGTYFLISFKVDVLQSTFTLTLIFMKYCILHSTDTVSTSLTKKKHC